MTEASSDGRSVHLQPDEEADGWTIRFPPVQVVEVTGIGEDAADLTVRGRPAIWCGYGVAVHTRAPRSPGDAEVAAALRAATTF